MPQTKNTSNISVFRTIALVYSRKKIKDKIKINKKKRKTDYILVKKYLGGIRNKKERNRRK